MEDQILYLPATLMSEDGLTAARFTERAPGYPNFAATIFALPGNKLNNIISVQILLDSGACIIFGLIVRRVIGCGFLIAGLLTAININSAILAAMVLPDTLFLFLFSLTLLFLVRSIQTNIFSDYLWCVFSITLATSIRPVSYYLLPAIIFGLIYFNYRSSTSIRIRGLLLRVFIGALIVLTVLAPRHLKNWQEFGALSYVSQGGTHLLGWVVPATYQYSGHGSYQAGRELAQNRLAEQMAGDGLRELPQNPFEASRYQAAVAKEILVELGVMSIMKAWVVGAGINMLAPSAAFAPAVRAMDHPSFYGTPGNGVLEKMWNYVNETSGLLYLSILGIGTLTQGVFVAAFLVGWWYLWRDAWSARKLDTNAGTFLFLTFVILYFLAITGPIIGSKYRLPLEPIMTVFAVAGYYRLRQSAFCRGT